MTHTTVPRPAGFDGGDERPPRSDAAGAATEPSPSPVQPQAQEHAGGAVRQAGHRARIVLGRGIAALSGSYYLVLGVTLFLVAIGLVMVLSSSSIFSFLDDQGFFGGFWKQVTFAALGIPLMLIVSRVPLLFWRRWAWIFLAAAMVLQLLVFTPLGIEDGGNRNWIAIGSINGQPSEAVKLALVVWLAAVLYAKRNRLNSIKHALIPVLPASAVALGLVLLGHDLGTTLILFAIVMAALFFAGVPFRAMLIPLAVGGLAVAVLAISSPNRMERIMSFLAPDCTDYLGTCWQPLNGLWALANGGVFGVGIGNSTSKWSWLPAAENDYIFAVIGEELGLVGAVVILSMYVLLAIGMVRVMRQARDVFGQVVVGTVLVWIIGQALVNIGVVVGVFPVLGVPLPLMSSGGTALLSSLVGIGLVLGVARDAQRGDSAPVRRRERRGARATLSG